jgi:hypothetical protein
METQTNLKKKSFTMVGCAIEQVKGFDKLYQEFEDKVLISGHSPSALENYSRKVAEVCLHFDRLPQDISEKDLNKYLADMARESRAPSLSNFKFTVYGLRYFYRLLGMSDRIVELPSIKAKKKLPQTKKFINDLYKTPWVVYSKEPFAGPEQVIEYLGRYTHKVAIGNHRLLKVDETEVRFSWRDYRDNKVKVMLLEGAEFLRRFCVHILPKKFVRIHHYGLLSTSHRQELRELQQAFGINTPKVREKKHWKEVCREHLNYDPDICPQCGKGHMSIIEMFFAPRPPPLPMAALNEYFVKL